MLSFEQIKKMDLAFLERGEQREPTELTSALIERYPFLVGRNRFTGEAIDHTGTRSEFYRARFHRPSESQKIVPRKIGCWTELSSLDCGWRKAFGIEICEDIRTVLLALGGEDMLNDYRIEQIKNKWASMRWYSSFESAGKHSGGLRLDGFGLGAFRGKMGEGESSRRWLTYVEEVYCDIAGHICIKCGSTDQIRRTDGWIVPICRNEERWEDSTPHDPPKKDEPFCVWNYPGPNGERIEISYKDRIVGTDAPIIDALGLKVPLHATEVWNRVAV